MQKYKNPKQVVADVFLGVILLFMASIIIRMFTKNILVEVFQMNNTFTKFILTDMNIADEWDEATGETLLDINWEERYPFRTGDDESSKEAGDNRDFYTKVNEKIEHVKRVVDDYCNEYLIERTAMVEKAYVYEKILGWSLLPVGGEDGIIVKDNGYLTYVSNKINVDGMVAHMTNFHKYLKESDIPLLYVQAPSKVSPVNPDLPAGVNDATNENMDTLLKELEVQQIDCLDLRQYINENFEEYEDAFYKTDHHWKTTTAFGAVGVLTDYLNQYYDFEFSPKLKDTSMYHRAVYHDYFLGSQGKKVTLGIAEPEDYELMEPLFETSFSIEIPERNIQMTGSFQDVILDYRHLETIDYYRENCYASFMNRNDAFARIINNNPMCNQNKKILIIKDSYSTPFIPYLALGVEEIVTVYELLFDGSIRTLVEEEQPDLVIVMYSATSMGDARTHTSFYNLE